MDLAATKKQLDKHSVYPERIKEEIENTLAKGNPDNKTLIDIHKAEYALLNFSEDLDNVKSMYPEFKDVLSDSEVKYNKGSFLDEAKKGEIFALDKDKDISLQLLQLYWGEGFSLKDLQKDFDGQNIYECFKKLNIPRVDKTYGQYLKFSDKDYNKRYTEEMAERARRIERKRSGNSVPRGPMSEEHKQAISEGLKKYYEEHPESVFEISTRMQQYYNEHPEAKEIFSQVLLRAWDSREAKPIRKRMSKFLQKELTSEEAVKLLTEKTPDSKNLKAFWEKNTWAKKVWSGCLTKSWARQDELSKKGLIYEPLTIDFMPQGVKKQVVKQLYKEYPEIEKYLNFFIPDKRDRVKAEWALPSEENDAVLAIMMKNPELYYKWTGSIMLGILSTFNDIQDSPMFSTKGTIYSKEFADKYRQFNKNFLDNDKNEPFTSMLFLYFALMQRIMDNGDLEFAKIIDKNMNLAYNQIKNKDNIDKFLIETLLI